MYNESTSKNNSGGLKNRKVKPKQVVHYANMDNPDRCFVKLLKKYREHRPSSCDSDAFYLTPIPQPKGQVWYKTTPIGVNTPVSKLCKKGGIEGYKTNHSLRVTAATRLFQKGIDEQLIMERMGHRSVDGVRAYKRTCSEQHEQLSNVLQGISPKRPKVGDSENAYTFDLESCKDNTNKEGGVLQPVLNFGSCQNIVINYNHGP